MIPIFLDKSQIPHKPGVYIYKNKSGRIIYVGKAVDLYHRVVSYFSKGDLSLKTQVLVSEIKSVETIIVESELEALILEANLIKKYLPQFNIRLTDDKDYLYIKITREDFPRVLTARKHELKGALKYFGPFPSSRTVNTTLAALRKVFRWESQNSKINSKRACFYYHLNICSGACVGEISKKDYRKNIFYLTQLLEGKKEKLIEDLVSDMAEESKKQNFEEAARLKKIIEGISYLTQSNRTQLYLENPNFLENQKELALNSLKKALKLPRLPERIEGYDISNIQGKDATGSMVVLTNGEIDKSQYRKFKIHISGKPNDVAMHREMMRRRLRNKDWPLPDLMIIDGGRGQVNAASFEIHSFLESRHLNLEIPVFGLAKRLEWLYSPDGRVIKLSRKDSALHLLQKLRDESHRFAITYFRKLHQRSSFGI